jgi:2-polyprenyl-3-methyl-5-hydroxy-6-metoxy-1,4-benzoquinol methylase
VNKSHFIERNCCPVCKYQSFNELISLPYSDKGLENYLKKFYNSQGKIEIEYMANESYTLLKCQNCSLIFQKFIPNDFLMSKLYEEWINPDFVKQESYDRSLFYYKQKALEIMDTIRFLDKKPSELKFMDFGMGWGEWCRLSKSFGVDTYGMELSKERIKNAQLYQIKNIEWENLPNHKFDLINTEQVIEHIPNPLETVKYLADSLNKGGLLKISVPNGKIAERNIQLLNWELPRDSEFSMHIATPLEHINVFKTESIIEMAKICGLTPIYNVNKQFFEENISFTQFLKLKLGPFYRKFKKPIINDTSIFFRKIN